MRRTLILAGAALGALVCSAHASDLPTTKGPPSAPPLVSAFSWTGFYAGAEFGYGWGDAPSPWGAVYANTFPFYQAAAHQSGVFGGGYVGFNYQVSSFVFGLEGDLNADGVDGNDGGSGGDVNGVRHRWNADIRGRLGYALFDRTLVYAAGGAAFLGGDATNLSGPGHNGITESIGTTWTGWTIGGGLETAFTSNIIGRVEYRYTDYGKSVANFPLSGYAEQIDPRISSVMVGLAYKF
jgi:outer membrane immunogenic protein